MFSCGNSAEKATQKWCKCCLIVCKQAIKLRVCSERDSRSIVGTSCNKVQALSTKGNLKRKLPEREENAWCKIIKRLRIGDELLFAAPIVMGQLRSLALSRFQEFQYWHCYFYGLWWSNKNRRQKVKSSRAINTSTERRSHLKWMFCPCTMFLKISPRSRFTLYQWNHHYPRENSLRWRRHSINWAKTPFDITSGNIHFLQFSGTLRPN